MSKPAKHIVHKLNLELEAPSEGQARYLYSQAGTILQQYVLPKLEAILQQYAAEEMHIRLETLNIDLQATAGASLENILREQLARAIGAKLKEELQRQEAGDKEEEAGIVKKRTGPWQVIEAFFIFLEKGTLPWWIADKEIFSQSRQIVDAIAQQEEQFVVVFLEKVTERPALLERLLLQYDVVLLTYLFSLLVPLEVFKMVLAVEQHSAGQSAAMEQELFRQKYWMLIWNLVPVKALPGITKELFYTRLEAAVPVVGKQESLFKLITVEVLSQVREANNITRQQHAEEKENDPLTELVLRTATPIEEGPDTITGEQTGKQGDKETDPGRTDNKTGKGLTDDTEPEYKTMQDGLLVDNAGLILLHPFLQYFFQELGLLEGEQLQQSKDIAVHLLHYLATGKEQAADFELVFEKYLCGLKPSQVTYRYTRLTDKMKTEAETLLSSVIKHWPVLKNTSASGLQEGFLQRKGKLIMKEDSHKLIMERSTLDILLGQLPWNISLVKLPWIRQMIHVEWAS